ncbi:peptidoglycan DD-metalloendopeptidase family protein [Acidobacteriota bacterium]
MAYKLLNIDQMKSSPLTQSNRAHLIYRQMFLFAALLIFLLCGCREEIVPAAYYPSNAHEAYIHSLSLAGMADTALAKDWIKISETSLEDPIEIKLPHQEIFYVDPGTAAAYVYTFNVKRGRRVEIIVEFQGMRAGRLFMDLFKIRGESPQSWNKVASSNSMDNKLIFEPRQDADYALRIQPELLRGGQYTLHIGKTAALDFPVPGYATRDIGSWFGDPRDGGRREHHGVDIFARRHSPVIAPTKAYVRSVRDDKVGGLNVWLEDTDRRMYIYFAHLQKIDVEPFTNVEAGQQIGTVGNTGNARTTPPHLHFAIYYQGQGAVDPFLFIDPLKDTPAPIKADLAHMGQWIRSLEPSIPLKSSLLQQAKSKLTLEKGSIMQVLAASSDQYRVQLPDGITGYVKSVSTESTDEALMNLLAQSSQSVTEAPEFGAGTKEEIQSGDELLILGKYAGHWFVQTLRGQTGWMPIPSPSPTDRD